MKRIMLLFSVIIGKMLIGLARLLGRGGSSLPGRIALRVCPATLALLAARLSRGVIVVTATNGKTTTTRMLAGMFASLGVPVVTNATGANMAGGITSALIEASRLAGGYRPGSLGVIEVDEGSIPAVLAALAPRIVLVGNFFRDQLDRYGEVAILARRVREAIAALSVQPCLVLNADDPLVASLAGERPEAAVWFGVEPGPEWEAAAGETADVSHCQSCGGLLEYSSTLIGHLGIWRCTACGKGRSEPRYVARQVVAEGLARVTFSFCRKDQVAIGMTLSFPGLHAVYNCLGALAVLAEAGFDPAAVVGWLTRFRPPYGRFETIPLDGRDLYLMLVKNPAGANVSLDLLARSAPDGSCLLILNDLAADGRDISWIYDARFEDLAGVFRAGAAGRRAAALGLRHVHAGVHRARVFVIPDIGAALEAALAATPAGQPLFIIATYTAMHEVRALLVARAGIREFWEDGK